MPKLVLDTTEWYSLGIPNTFNNISENVTVNISPVIDLLISFHDKFIIEDYYSITKQDIINFLREINDPNCIFVKHTNTLQISSLLTSETGFYLFIEFSDSTFDSVRVMLLQFFEETQMSDIICMMSKRDGDFQVL